MNKTATEILNILEKNRGRAVSGEEIASKLHITRSAVWKNVNHLKKEGYDILSTNNRGYELTEENDILTADSIERDFSFEELLVKTEPRVEVFDEVSSTNSLIKERARKGEEEGLVLVAKKQTAGRGRLGRSFFSPKKGLYMSFLLRPKLSFKDALILTTIGAVAVVEAIKELTGKEASIKWVNDVYYNDKKVCGILTEAEADMENGFLSYAVVGIGINLTEPTEGVPEELKDIAGFLFGKEEAPKDFMSKFCALLIKKFFYYYEKLPKKDFMNFYQSHQFLLNKDIFVISSEEKKRAKVYGVDDEARLLVEYEDGQREALFTGEVSIREVGKEEKNPPKFSKLTKSIFLFLFLFLPLLMGCERKEASPSMVENLEEEEKLNKGFVFSVYDEEFYIGEDIAEKIKHLLEPNSTYEAPSCARLGEEVIYTYSGFSLSAYKEGEKEVLQSILITDDSVTTKEGLFIGADEKKVIELYGNTLKKSGVLAYPKGETKLLVVIEKEKVLSIEYRKKDD